MSGERGIRPVKLVAALLGAPLLAIAAQVLADWPWTASAMAGIFAMACFLWVTEAVPLFATSLLVFGAVAMVCANPGGWSCIDGGARKVTFAEVVEAVADPVMLLFFGGFLMARAAEKTGLDGMLSRAMLRPFVASPSRLLLGVMAISGVFSMWTSNTATAALLVAILGPILTNPDTHKGFRKSLLLGVAFGANIGSMATPIGSPPNLVAMGIVEELGGKVEFGEWMMIGLPLSLVLLLAAWGILLAVFRPSRGVPPWNPHSGKWSTQALLVGAVFLLTVALWLGEGLFGLPPAVVALVPIVLLPCAGVLNASDLKQIDWGILILVAGGIVLGAGMRWSGLDAILAGLFSKLPLQGWALFAVAGVLMVLLSTFISNTASANLLLPVFVPLAAKSGDTTTVAMALAFSASLAFSLPISTPPNAVVHSRGGLNTLDGVFPGLLCALVGWILIFLFLPLCR